MEKENDKAYQKELIANYRRHLDACFRYIPWLQERKGSRQEKMYDGEDVSGTIAVPVYDSTLLNLVRSLNETGLMNRNYPYTYSRYGLRTHDDELRQIELCDIKTIDVIIGIISKYILGGMSKGKLWTDAVEEGIFYFGLAKIKEILDFWGSE